MSLIKILAIELILVFIFTNILFINNVFLVPKRYIEAQILKAIYIILVLVAFILIGILNSMSLIFLILVSTLGIRYLRGLKTTNRIATKAPSFKYYWELYAKNFLQPTLSIFSLGAFGTVFLYLANYLVLK